VQSRGVSEDMMEVPRHPDDMVRCEVSTCIGCPQILITTSRDPSTRLVQFAKELKLVFPNSKRMNRGGQASLQAAFTACSSLARHNRPSRPLWH